MPASSERVDGWQITPKSRLIGGLFPWGKGFSWVSGQQVMAREALSKKLRFDVFKRDLFTCQYCGQKPPAVILEVDHIVAVVVGGTNQMDNLATACFTCNRGKGANGLEVAPATLQERQEIILEKRAQLKAYERLLKREQRETNTDIDSVQAALLPEGDVHFTDSFRSSIKQFLEHMSVIEIVEFAKLAAQRCSEPVSRTKYLCGCCWRTINGDRKHGRWTPRKTS